MGKEEELRLHEPCCRDDDGEQDFDAQIPANDEKVIPLFFFSMFSFSRSVSYIRSY